ncbi:MAG: hypothetical protein ABSE62_07045 [Chthoniobacteraceae bacterium]|jgi:hypothetical protein
MSTLTEIEVAADQLRPEEKQELILFLATRLRACARPEQRCLRLVRSARNKSSNGLPRMRKAIGVS